MDLRDVEQPVMIHRRRGGWLAISHPELELRIGVIGQTEDEARIKFAERVESWAKSKADESANQQASH